MTDKILNWEDGAAAKMLQCSVVTSDVKATAMAHAMGSSPACTVLHRVAARPQARQLLCSGPQSLYWFPFAPHLSLLV